MGRQHASGGSSSQAQRKELDRLPIHATNSIQLDVLSDASSDPGSAHLRGHHEASQKGREGTLYPYRLHPQLPLSRSNIHRSPQFNIHECSSSLNTRGPEDESLPFHHEVPCHSDAMDPSSLQNSSSYHPNSGMCLQLQG